MISLTPRSVVYISISSITILTLALQNTHPHAHNEEPNTGQLRPRMGSTFEHAIGSDELTTVLRQIMAGHLLSRPGPVETDMTPLDGYFYFLSQRSPIFSIVRNNKCFWPGKVTQPQRGDGMFRLSFDPLRPAVRFYPRYYNDPGCANTESGLVNGRDDVGGGARLITVDDVYQHTRDILGQSIDKVANLADFVTTSWQMRTDDPEHPLWRPVRVQFTADPFQPGLADFTGKTESDLNDYEKAVLLSRQAAELEVLYHNFEIVMACLFAVGQAKDKGASFSADGTDVFAANAGLVADFAFFHRFYMGHYVCLNNTAKIKNGATVEECMFQQDYSSVLDGFVSMGI